MFKNPFLLFIFAFVVLIMFLPAFTKVQDIKQKDREYQERITALEKENKSLKIEHWRLEEDPTYLEKVAREKMGLIKEGEVIYHINPANAVE